jgi:hypothetical protein
MCLLVRKIITQLLYYVGLIFIYVPFFDTVLIRFQFLQYYLLRQVSLRI